MLPRTHVKLLERSCDRAVGGWLPGEQPEQVDSCTPTSSDHQFCVGWHCTRASTAKHMLESHSRQSSASRREASCSRQHTTRSFTGIIVFLPEGWKERLPGDNALRQAIGNKSVLAGIAGLSGAVDTLALKTSIGRRHHRIKSRP